MIEFVNSYTFEIALKRLAKKYKSIGEDIQTLKKDLSENPKQGADLGSGLRKVRMAIASKNKGKSGGARVITYVDAITADLDGKLLFLFIYDKSDRSTITDKELINLLKSEGII